MSDQAVGDLTVQMPDPADDPVLRWGILGAGSIAGAFVDALQQCTGQQVVAVGARDAGRAREFARRHGIEESYGSYEELVASRPDVIYVATTHPQHLPHGLLALEAGIPVLVEKPLGLDAADVRRLADAAAANDTFCAEALWSVHTPTWTALREVLEQVGPVVSVMADLGQTIEPGHRMLEADLAGGPVHDMGLYPLALVTHVMGPVRRAVALSTPHPAGVAGQVGAVLECDDGLAVMHTSLLGRTPNAAFLQTPTHLITLDPEFYTPGGFTVTPLEGRVAEGPWAQERRFDAAQAGAAGHLGLHWQAGAVARALRDGRRELDLWPLSSSLATARAMDAVREAAGVDMGQARAARARA